ncbi:hypothetical protein A2382_03615 [Candidatus Woesebacteria bacterium RIFOXYB1_FULL_38_16]|uniref:Uncharacterized protein n=1 Tax=Candidatus Woesebacteria bacterium RIFOXYB1_FULL_38_16 TaxID=1802538 RepID=A0A1F8CTR9_9BACT|nr:MAG: hypothetical protein A2191_02085 [Candidatus Woesebacteria bacterium RIFOXYA1_FULL_38_9]OGM78975.1 MAG: hypothetical protein A2382_03615 [Candidatus Woesebacteria bacterium RIFOXYB1_FULL_38_16]
MKKNWVIIGIILLVSLLAGVSFLLNRPLPPMQDELTSRKTVEDYFMEHMRVSAEEAKTMASDGVMLRLSPSSTLQGVVGNLYYYGFIDDEAKFRKLLETVTDSTPGKEESIKADKNTIDVNSNYYLNYSMNDEEIADTLLNKAKFEPNFTQYNYLFMPGGREK